MPLLTHPATNTSNPSTSPKTASTAPMSEWVIVVCLYIDDICTPLAAQGWLIGLVGGSLTAAVDKGHWRGPVRGGLDGFSGKVRAGGGYSV